MSENEAVQGLTCPKCGGVIAIPEGQEIVQCPYCDLRSVVRGERGLRHYQVPCRITREQATTAFQQFLHSNMAIAADTARSARLSESFVAYLPFWAAWGRALGWVFGEKQVGSGEHKRYEPREVRFAEEMSWNGAACDVGEFGVSQVPLTDQQIQPFQVEALHSTGMVFEPVGSQTDARSAAEAAFQERVRGLARLDRISQQFVRIVRQRLGLVYYPLWIMRYLYRGRAFQVAVDGYSGKVLYGKAPGNTLYRAAMLVGGMALGAFMAIDIPALILSGRNSHGDSFGAAVVLFAVGFGIMYAAYRAFRYGEQYEYRSGPKKIEGLDMARQFGQQFGDVGKIIDMLGR